LIKSVENVNHQLLVENVFLRNEMGNAKANILKLVEENTALHNELKSTTVVEILNEFHNQADLLANQNQKLNASDPPPAVQNQLKAKE
jgi:hypothetical protein